MAVYERNPITGEETIVAGIQDINGFETRLTNIEDMIPNDASSSNKLVDEGSLGTASAKDATDVVRAGSHDLVESNAVANAINQALSSIYVPRGDLSCAELTSALLIEANVGNVYEMSDSGTTSALFIQGAGTTISVGDNVGIIKAGQNTYMFNYMGNAFDLTAYQKKELTTAIEGATTVEGALGVLSTNKIDVSSGICAHGTNEPFMAGQPIRTYLLGLDSSIKFATFTVDPTASTVTDKINTTEYFSYNCYKQGSSWRVFAINSNGNKMYITDVSSSVQTVTWKKVATESDIIAKVETTSTLDANNCTETGYYTNVNVNQPISGYGFTMFTETSSNNSYCHQTAHLNIADDLPSITYVRKGRYLNDAWVWSSWQKLVTESDVNPIIDVSTVWDGTNHALNINTLLITYGLGSYMIYGQGTSGHGCLLLNVWKVISGSFAYSWQKIYNNNFPTNISGGGVVYESPTLTLESTNMGEVNNIKRISKI